jgi:uncharacterized membrane protein YeiH
MPMDIPSAVQMLAIMAFAITGIIAVSARGIDLFSACVFGTITALGGGTARDVILGAPVFWSVDLTYIWAALAASLMAFIAKPLLDRRHLFRLMLYLDGFGAALFAVQAANKVWDLGFGVPVAPVILGVVTAIGGGLIRDVLAGHTTLLMNRDLYAIPVTLGCVLYVLALAYIPEHRLVSAIVCVSLIFGFRAAVIHWDLRVPHWLMANPRND